MDFRRDLVGDALRGTVAHCHAEAGGVRASECVFRRIVSFAVLVRHLILRRFTHAGRAERVVHGTEKCAFIIRIVLSRIVVVRHEVLLAEEVRIARSVLDLLHRDFTASVNDARFGGIAALEVLRFCVGRGSEFHGIRFRFPTSEVARVVDLGDFRESRRRRAVVE